MLADSFISERVSQMSNEFIVTSHEHKGTDTATAFNALWLMRLVSTLNLILSGVACLATEQMSHVVAATAFFISLVVTWSPPRRAAWLWGGACVIGLVFTALCLRVM